jgi:hypothetical protein
LLETPFNQAETAAVQDTQHLDTPSSVTRRHSFKESSDVKRKRSMTRDLSTSAVATHSNLPPTFSRGATKRRLVATLVDQSTQSQR